MNHCENLPPDLRRAAETLEARLSVLNAPAYKIPLSEWGALDSTIRNLVPSWLVSLLSNYSIAGVVLEFENHVEKQTWPVGFGMFLPVTFRQNFQSESLYLDLLRFGFIPFASESDGNVWVATVNDGPSGNIYLLEFSAWSGAMPHKDNGLIYAHRNLACVLSCMAVSNETFELRGGMCMWQPVRNKKDVNAP